MIVGISGLAGSGKDTLSDMLTRDHGFVKLSFADPMKRFCREIFDFSADQLWGPSASRNAPDPRYPRKWGDGEISATERMVPVVTEYLTPRYALQTLGTEWGRDCYPGIWVEYALRIAKGLDGRSGVSYEADTGIFRCARPMIAGVAIPDCRFKNEIDAVRAAGGKLVRIVRPGAGLGGAAGLHPSEAEQASISDEAFDLVIQNDGTLAELKTQVRSAVESLLG